MQHLLYFQLGFGNPYLQSWQGSNTKSFDSDED